MRLRGHRLRSRHHAGRRARRASRALFIPNELMAFLGLVPCRMLHRRVRARLGASPRPATGTPVGFWWRRLGSTASRAHDRSRAAGPPGRPASSRARDRLAGAAAPVSRYRRLSARGLHQNKICIAIARELCRLHLGSGTPSHRASLKRSPKQMEIPTHHHNHSQPETRRANTMRGILESSTWASK